MADRLSTSVYNARKANTSETNRRLRSKYNGPVTNTKKVMSKPARSGYMNASTQIAALDKEGY